jgi:hypothetical protein
LDEGSVTDDVPLTLWNERRWELLGARDAERFFKNIGSALVGGTTLFVEGTSQSLLVRQTLDNLRVPGPYIPKRQTIWPHPGQWRLPFTPAVLDEMTKLASAHAGPELADHLFIYAGDTPVLEWPDAFSSDAPMFISATVPEQHARDLAKRLGGTIKWVDWGGRTGGCS